MALNDVVFVKGEGGLARQAEGEDHISGILFFGSKPLLWGSDDVKQLFSIKQAEDAGIVDTGSTAVWHYHIAEFFRIQPNSGLYVGIYDVQVSGAEDFNEVLDMQQMADGKIRQLAVYYTGADFATSQITALQAKAQQLYTEHQPLVILYAPDISDTADATTLADLRALTAPYVAVCIGQDGNATGKSIFTALGKSVTCIGAMLGAVSRAQVHENIGWVANFNMAETELDVIALANGDAIKDLTATELTAINTKGYIFLRKHIGRVGSYFNDSFTAVAATSDYATIENNRTIDKAVRGIRTALLPALNSPLRVDRTTGKLSSDVVKYFENLASSALETMDKAGEVSGFSVTVNPDQNILSTSKLVIDVKIVPVGVAREIEVGISFTLNV